MEDNEILKYAEGKKVSNKFLSRLQKDIKLQKEVTELKNDILLMEKLENSPMFNLIKEKSRLVIKNNSIIENILFSFTTPLTARSAEINKNKKENIIYSFKNIEINIINNEVILHINKIQNYLKIQKDKKEILNIEAGYNYYRSLLEKGYYFIDTDGNTSEIVIK